MMISTDEVKRYDRQIRLWGVEVQHRLQNSTILIKRITGATAEIAKNLLAAGVSLVIADDRILSKELVESENWILRCHREAFLKSNSSSSLTVAEVAIETLSKINPLAKISKISESITESSYEYFNAIAVGEFKEIGRDDDDSDITIPIVYVQGNLIIVDAKKIIMKVEKKTRKMNYPSLSKVLLKITDRKEEDDIVISSIVGGLAAQELWKLISHKEFPIANCIIFDSVNSRASIFKSHENLYTEDQDLDNQKMNNQKKEDEIII